MKRLLLLAGLLVIATSCMSQKNKNNKDMNTERLTYFSFDHHNAMAMSGEKYTVMAMKDGRTHVVIDEGFPSEKELYLDGTTILDDLLDIVKTYNMDKYKEDYQPKMRVFDGDSWNLYYKYDSKRTVRSGGYMEWPKNYFEMRHALSDYFKKWREQQEGVLVFDFFKYTSKNSQGRDLEYSIERGEKEATVTIVDAERGINKTFRVSNDLLLEFQQVTNVVNLKSTLYDYNPSGENATHSTYFVRYNTGDTLSGITGYTDYPNRKESAILEFFSQWTR